METWIALAMLFCFLAIMECYVKKTQQKKIGLIMFFLAWFITAFRYEIGWDYSSYKRIYLENVFDEPFHEPGFSFVIEVLRFCGFDYQMMFVIFATLTYGFLWKGVTFYKNKFNYINYGLSCLLFFMGPILSLYQISAVRQIFAVTIFFYASRYIVEKRIIKYVVFIFLASMFHFSAILLMPIYWVANLNIKERGYLLLSLLVGFMYYSNTMENFMNLILPEESMYIQYLNSYTESTVGIVIVFFVTIFVLAILIKFNDTFQLNMIFIALSITFLFVNNPPFLRIRLYFFVFFIIFYQGVMYFLSKKLKSRLIILFLIPIFAIYLNDWQMMDYHNSIDYAINPKKSVGNIEYEFNFHLIND